MPTKKTKKEVKKEIPKEKISEKYFFGVGRRKASVAQVRLYPGEKIGEDEILINKRKVKEYFPTLTLQAAFMAPFRAVGMLNKFKVSALARGGGIKGQAEAVKLGIARALVKFDENYRKTLKDLKLLTRDSRKVERKKPGLKKARRAPQWNKR